MTDAGARFASKFTAAPSGCWEWTATRTRTGYGMFRFGGKNTKASRVSWMLARGPIPAGLHVLHVCDNRGCVNPAHLFLGSHLDNMKDKVVKGRQARTGNMVSAAKTHCPSGHLYDDANTILYRGMRYCRACSKKHKAAHEARKRAAP